jgi:hypothetical protein
MKFDTNFSHFALTQANKIKQSGILGSKRPFFYSLSKYLTKFPDSLAEFDDIL